MTGNSKMQYQNFLVHTFLCAWRKHLFQSPVCGTAVPNWILPKIQNQEKLMWQPKISAIKHRRGRRVIWLMKTLTHRLYGTIIVCDPLNLSANIDTPIFARRVLSVSYDQNESPTWPIVISPNSSLNATKSLREYKKKRSKKVIRCVYLTKKQPDIKTKKKHTSSSSYPSLPS